MTKRAVDRNDAGDRLQGVRREARERLPFTRVMTGGRGREAHVAADDRPLTDGGGVPEIVAVDEPDGQAALGGVVRDGEPRDPAADDEDVERAGDERIEITDHAVPLSCSAWVIV
ncbi:MAG: hypothetical protein LAO77_20230 [Acidobacteriia bacterium]|nr:hypothetical protein [Terriglobia bacterium]